jgi:hypothetical protein
MQKPFRYPLNIQFFSEENPGDDDDKSKDTDTSGDEEQPVTFKSQSEFDSTVDKKISKALETARTKWSAEAEEKIKKEREDAERLAKLSKDERKEAEFKKREEELKAKEEELNKRDFLNETTKQLNDKGLSPEFAEFVAVYGDADKTFERIGKLDEAIKSEVQKKVDEKLKTSADNPSGGSGPSGTVNPWNPKTRNLTQQGKILQEDPALAQRLMKQAGV